MYNFPLHISAPYLGRQATLNPRRVSEQKPSPYLTADQKFCFSLCFLGFFCRVAVLCINT
jgi:hypothetical protein